MNDQAKAKKSSEGDLPEVPDERPLVTFALFAYNQQEFIREAVEAAFAQTYSPLEIILSDDCSSDETFAIMQQMAEAYDGPHRVRLVKNKANMGLIQHFLTRCREAEGEFVVVAAGDDVSKPERVSLTVGPMIANDEVYATVSLVDIVDDKGLLIASDKVRPEHMDGAEMYSGNLIFMKSCRSKRTILQGCASTYRKTVFDIEIPNEKSNFAEDFMFSFYINLLEKLIIEVPRSLVSYRMHGNAMSNNQFANDSDFREISFYKFAKDNVNLCDIFINLTQIHDKSEKVLIEEIINRKNKMAIALIWKEAKFFTKLQYVIKGLIFDSELPVKWMTSRLFGSYPKYQPRSLISKFSVFRR